MRQIERRCFLIFIAIDNLVKDSPAQPGPIFDGGLIREESLVDMYFLLQNEFGPPQNTIQK